MKKEQIQNLAKEFCEAEGIVASTGIWRNDENSGHIRNDLDLVLAKFLQSMIDQGHITEAPFNSDVNESCDRAKWLMENRLFDSEEYGEHPDVCELYEIIEDLQKSVKPVESPVSDKWISVKDRLPEVGKRVLVYRKNIKMSSTDQYDAFPGDRFSFHYSEVTHWMPLPAAPGETTVSSAGKEVKTIERPIGDFIIDQTDIHPFSFHDGSYYHYKDVCTMLNRFKKSSPGSSDLGYAPEWVKDYFAPIKREGK